MVFNGKPFRHDLSQLTWTVVHVEDTLALIALKVMMVSMPSRLITGNVARQGNHSDFAFIKQTFQGPIDRGLTKAWHL